jgi:membrane associated rhomboid family serine protease
MDWGLVLASQGIQAVIDRSEQGWQLIVEEGDYAQAQACLSQYELENRGWRWKHKLPGSGIFFHWASAGWAAAIAWIYFLSQVRFPTLQQRGMMDNQAVRSGQWWRLFTAITLHENLAHLVANLTVGFVLLGLAMGRYGAGVALLAAFLAGAVGNCAGLLVYPARSQSLGASGMVMGALGLLSVQSISFWRRFRPARVYVLRSAAGALLILVLVGFAEGSDIVAHVGGFLSGAILGIVLAWVRPSTLHRRGVNLAGTAFVVLLLLTAWWEAIR